MRRGAKRSRWPAVRRNLLLGLLLGLLQLLVISGVVIWQFPLPWWLSVGAGAVFYLLIPGLAGFLAAQKTPDDNVGVGAGCLVGAVSICIAITEALIVDAQTPHPPLGLGRPNNGGFLLFLVVFSEALGGTIVTVIGSSVGESLGQRCFLALYQSNKIAANDT